MYIHTDACVCIYIHQVYIHTYIHTSTQTHTRARTHTHTHANIYINSKVCCWSQVAHSQAAHGRFIYLLRVAVCHDTATHEIKRIRQADGMRFLASHCNTLQRAATHCNTLQHTATCCNTLQQHTSTRCNALHHTATHCTTLHHTATHFKPCASRAGRPSEGANTCIRMILSMP